MYEQKNGSKAMLTFSITPIFRDISIEIAFLGLFWVAEYWLQVSRAVPGTASWKSCPKQIAITLDFTSTYLSTDPTNHAQPISLNWSPTLSARNLLSFSSIPPYPHASNKLGRLEVVPLHGELVIFTLLDRTIRWLSLSPLTLITCTSPELWFGKVETYTNAR